MLLDEEEWVDLRAYRALKDAGATWAEIAREERARLADGEALPGAPAPRRPARRPVASWR